MSIAGMTLFQVKNCCINILLNNIIWTMSCLMYMSNQTCVNVTVLKNNCLWLVSASHGNVGFLFNYMQIDWNQSAKPKFLITLDDQEIQWWVFWNKEKIKVKTEVWSLHACFWIVGWGWNCTLILWKILNHRWSW